MAKTGNSGSFAPGHKGGGRPKGATNLATRLLREKLPEGEEYDANELIGACFAVVRDQRAKRGEVVQAASVALPYLRPKLSAIEVSGGEGGAPVRIRVVLDAPKEPEPGK